MAYVQLFSIGRMALYGILLAMALPCVVFAGASGAGKTDAWSALRTNPDQGTLWKKGLTPEEIARRANALLSTTTSKQPAPSLTPVRRKSPPPTWRGDTQEQREAMRLRSHMPERSLQQQDTPSHVLPFVSNVEDRSLSWHADPNRYEGAGEPAFADRRQTIAGMLGYSDSRVAFGIGPEITIEDGQQAKSLMHGRTPSPSDTANQDSSKEQDSPPAIDVGMGMRLRVNF